jgi:hypothetical protein
LVLDAIGDEMTNRIRIECFIFRDGMWYGAPLHVIEKGDWFRIPGSESTHIANEDAYHDEFGWHVDADMYRRNDEEIDHKAAL